MAEAPDSYPAFLAELKQRIRSARLQAALSLNRELVLLYWSIGRDILARQRAEGWGAKVIDRLAADLRRAFPEMTGISARNLKYMRAFAEAWPHEESGLFARQGGALTNFSRTLPAEQSELAQQISKDPYSFDFLSLTPQMRERDLERALIEHLRSLILELGKGSHLSAVSIVSKLQDRTITSTCSSTTCVCDALSSLSSRLKDSSPSSPAR